MIEADDGTEWVYCAATNDWTGWEPGIDGCWILTLDEMREGYPEVLAAASEDAENPAEMLA